MNEYIILKGVICDLQAILEIVKYSLLKLGNTVQVHNPSLDTACMLLQQCAYVHRGHLRHLCKCQAKE